MKVLSTEEFIERAISKHKNKYDYSLVDYKKNRVPVKIICKIHGVFEQKANSHLNGYGCQLCARKKTSTALTKTLDTLLQEFNLKHNNKYDYSKASYVDTSSKIKIICPIHSEFEQSTANHLKGQGCSKCAKNFMDTNYFIETCSNLHKNKYNYVKTVYKSSHQKLTITCPKHGDFQIQASCHLQGGGCQKCRSSKGELFIEEILKGKYIFSRQYKLKACKNKNPLPFDFAVFEDEEKTKLKCLIEYDGEQHFKICPNFSMTEDTLKEIQYHDKIKTDFCKENNIKLIRIPYWDYRNITEILSGEI